VTRYDARPSARSAGFSAINPDFNGAEQECAGLHQHNVRGGLRFNTALAFLDPVHGRANLTVITGELVTGLVIDGDLVTGVRARVGGADCVIGAARRSGAPLAGVNGLAALLAGRPLCATRPLHFFRSDGPMPEAVELRLTIPPGLGPADDVLAELRERVGIVEAERAAERQRTGRRVCGRRTVLAQSWRGQPVSRGEPSARGSRLPTVGADGGATAQPRLRAGVHGGSTAVAGRRPGPQLGFARCQFFTALRRRRLASSSRTALWLTPRLCILVTAKA
jgi:hypothetical protein